MEIQAIDTLVVGAGPAGSAAATMLARAGQDTVLCDRHAFPRDKPCGDLIGARALALARALGVNEDLLRPYPPLLGASLLGGQQIVDLVPRTAVGRFVLRNSDARVIPRRLFDSALLDTALGAGARFRALAVRHVGPWDERHGGRMVSAQGPDGPVQFLAKGVVLAGGYGCRVAPEVIPDPGLETSDPPRGIAMRGYVSGVRRLEGRIAFCLDDWMLPGYGWVFPLPDGGANVGVGTLSPSPGTTSEPLRELYDRFTQDPASPVAPYLGDVTPVAPPRSWPLDLGPRRRRLAAPGLVVAGEAAGLVGPLTGAGIAFALESGINAGTALAQHLAAESPTGTALHSYARETSRRTLPWLRTEQVAQRWLSEPEHVQSLFFGLRRLPGSGTIGARLLLHLG